MRNVNNMEKCDYGRHKSLYYRIPSLNCHLPVIPDVRIKSKIVKTDFRNNIFVVDQMYKDVSISILLGYS